MRHLIALFIFVFLVSVTDASAQKTKKTRKQKPKTETQKSVRGAATTDELGKLIFDALQQNNFEAIEHYFPMEIDLINTEKKTPDEDLKLVLEERSPADLQVSFKADFEAIQNKSLEQGLSLKDLSLMEVQTGAPSKANRLLPVHLLLTNRENQTMGLTFEALKINGRFFLFEHLKVKE